MTSGQTQKFLSIPRSVAIKWHPDLGTVSYNDYGNPQLVNKTLTPICRAQDRIRIHPRNGTLRLDEQGPMNPEDIHTIIWGMGWGEQVWTASFSVHRSATGPQLQPSLDSLTYNRSFGEARLLFMEHKEKKLRHAIKAGKETRMCKIQNYSSLKDRFTFGIKQWNGTGFHSDTSNLFIFSAIHVP